MPESGYRHLLILADAEGSSGCGSYQTSRFLTRSSGEWGNGRPHIRASERNNSPSCLSVGPSPALHPPPHIPICADAWAWVSNQNPARYCGIISFRDPNKAPLNNTRPRGRWNRSFAGPGLQNYRHRFRPRTEKAAHCHSNGLAPRAPHSPRCLRILPITSACSIVSSFPNLLTSSLTYCPTFGDHLPLTQGFVWLNPFSDYF